MAKTLLNYFKTILPNFSFDIELLTKEYKKAINLLNQTEQLNLNAWITKKGLKLQPIRVKN